MKHGLLISLLLVSACSKTVVPPALHDLGSARQTTAAANVAQLSVTAPVWLNDHLIHYRLLHQSASEVRAYNLDRWLAPPPELLRQRLLVDGVNPGFPLEIELLEFEQLFHAPNQAEASLRLLVRVYGAGGHRLIAGRQFALSKTCPSPDAKGAVVALSGLVKQASGQLHDWLHTLTEAPLSGSHLNNAKTPAEPLF